MQGQMVSDDTRAKAEALAPQVKFWARGRSKAHGYSFYYAPSCTIPGVAYEVNRFQCRCPSGKNRSACVHRLAVLAYERQQAMTVIEDGRQASIMVAVNWHIGED